MNLRRLILAVVALIAAAFLLLQIVPYGRAHENPPVVSEPNWNNVQTRELAQRACFDCHSNETMWPWYSNVAPVSWLVQHDVEEGRAYLNFSEWGQGKEGEEGEELYQVIAEGEMPPSQFLLLHPEAKLTDAERDALLQGLLASTGTTFASEGEHGEGDED